MTLTISNVIYCILNESLFRDMISKNSKDVVGIVDMIATDINPYEDWKGFRAFVTNSFAKLYTLYLKMKGEIE